MRRHMSTGHQNWRKRDEVALEKRKWQLRRRSLLSRWILYVLSKEIRINSLSESHGDPIKIYFKGNNKHTLGCKAPSPNPSGTAAVPSGLLFPCTELGGHSELTTDFNVVPVLEQLLEGTFLRFTPFSVS